MIDWTRFRPLPLVDFGGTATHCFGCDQDAECALYIVRLRHITRELPTYYCADCAMLAKANWTGDFKSCVPARTEIRMEPKLFARVTGLVAFAWDPKRPFYSLDVLGLLLDGIAESLANVEPECSFCGWARGSHLCAECRAVSRSAHA